MKLSSKDAEKNVDFIDTHNSNRKKNNTPLDRRYINNCFLLIYRRCNL